MSLIFEIGILLFTGFAVITYVADTLYWIYDNEKEIEENEKEDEEAEKIKEQIAKTLYS